MKKLLVALLLFVILFPAGIVFFRPNAVISKQQAKAELATPNSHFIKWRGAEIHYVDEGSGQPILMIHGFGGSYHNFDKFAAALKNQFRVIRVDLPGFGLSDFPAVTGNEDYISDYREFSAFILDTLNLDSVYVIGNSMGGAISWGMASDHPDKVKKLVLLNSAGYDIKAVSAKLAMFKFTSIGKVFERGMPMFMSRRGIERCFADDSKINPDDLVFNNKIVNREGNIQHMLALGRAQQFPDTGLIKQVQCPTLIVWGDKDEIVPVEHAQYFKRDIPNSQVIIYENCGHIPMVEKTEELKRDFLAFVKE